VNNMARSLRIPYLIAAFFLALSMALDTGSLAADTQPSRTGRQIEVTIIHVDKYGVYAPNLIFYWDPGMTKQKVSTLTAIADHLRNKDAVITYSTISDITKDKRPILIDIAPLNREMPQSTDYSPTKEPSVTALPDEEKTVPAQSKKELKTESNEPTPQKPGKETEAVQPKPASPGSPIITRTEVVNFVHDCIDAAQSKDIERSLGCYGEQVDYYSKGTVNKDFIRRDKGYYFRTWDKIRSSIDGDIVLIVIDQPDLRIAKFNSRFYVENARNTASGTAENIWKIQKISNELKIVDEKQKILERDSR